MRERVPLVLSVTALGASVLLWFSTGVRLNELGRAQAALEAEVAVLSKATLVDVKGFPALGPAEATVTLVEFSDYECPFCIRHFQQTMPRIEADYIATGRIRYVFRDFPVDQLHPAAIKAHEAARCMDEQARFWPMHRRLFSAAGTHSAEALEEQARAVGGDLNAFRACVGSGRHTAGVRDSAALALTLGASGTPAFFIGVRDLATDQVKVRQAVAGAQPYDVFTRILDELLKQ